MYPVHISDEDKDYSWEPIISENFAKEIDALRKCESIGCTPSYVAHDERTQDITDPLPNGNLRILVMSKVPGEWARGVSELLSDEEDIPVIRKQVLDAFE